MSTRFTGDSDGKQQATDVIFPNSSMDLVEGIYKGNVVSDLFNDILGRTLVEYIQERVAEDPSLSTKDIGDWCGYRRHKRRGFRETFPLTEFDSGI